MRRRTSAMPPNEHPSFRRAAHPQASARQERTQFLNWCWARASGPSHELPKRTLERDRDVVMHGLLPEAEVVDHPRRGRTRLDVRTQHNRQRLLMPEREALEQRRCRSRVARGRRAQDRPQHLVPARHHEEPRLARQRLHRHCDPFHRRCLRRRRRAPPQRRRTRRRACTRWPRRPSYRNGCPSRSAMALPMRAAERGTRRSVPRGRNDRRDFAGAVPSSRASPRSGTRLRSSSDPDSRRRIRKPPPRSRRSGSARKHRHPRGRHPPRAKKLPRPSALGHLRPVSVHARHEGSGLYTWAIYFAVRSIATRPRPTTPLFGRYLARRSDSYGSRRSLAGDFSS